MKTKKQIQILDPVALLADRPVDKLVRGQVGALDARGIPSITDDADVAAYTAWTGGVLSFRGVPLGRITRELERWYDVSIQLRDPALASKVLAVTFDNQQLDDAMQVLAKTADLQYARTGRSVTLTPRRAR